MNTKRPRRLDLNAPLLSTRRSATVTSIELSHINSLGGSCDGVPFSWEQSPGKPKDVVKRETDEDKAVPLPKPPPIRWQEESTLARDNACEGDVEGGDDDNEDVYDDDESFSDAIDLFSLAESLNTNERLETDNMREDVDLESDISGNNGSSSPNFMIQRFLPAATALAASSLSALTTSEDLSITTTNNIHHHHHNKHVYSGNKNIFKEGSCVPKGAGQAYSSSKGCGLEMLFPWPWRAKHKLCGVKSPVRRVHSNLINPQLCPRNK